jgi:hypothetical protein
MKNALRLAALLLVSALGVGTAAAQGTVNFSNLYYPTPSWNQALPCATTANCTRFLVLLNFGGAAVLDRETGLVWERSPGDMNGDKVVNSDDVGTWYNARGHCAAATTGGRKGWRLPSFVELTSLVDPSVPPPGPTLPPGHPFTNIQTTGYWSATTQADSETFAYFVVFGDGHVDSIFKTDFSLFAWCVRGGMNADKY